MQAPRPTGARTVALIISVMPVKTKTRSDCAHVQADSGSEPYYSRLDHTRGRSLRPPLLVRTSLKWVALATVLWIRANSSLDTNLPVNLINPISMQICSLLATTQWHSGPPDTVRLRGPAGLYMCPEGDSESPAPGGPHGPWPKTQLAVVWGLLHRPLHLINPHTGEREYLKWVPSDQPIKYHLGIQLTVTATFKLDWTAEYESVMGQLHQRGEIAAGWVCGSGLRYLKRTQVSTEAD
jgi:hypothetical protein